MDAFLRGIEDEENWVAVVGPPSADGSYGMSYVMGVELFIDGLSGQTVTHISLFVGVYEQKEGRGLKIEADQTRIDPR